MRNSRYFLFALLLLGACKSQESATTRVQTPAAKDALTPSQRADVTYLFFNANKEKILGNYNAAADLFAEVIRNIVSYATHCQNAFECIPSVWRV